MGNEMCIKEINFCNNILLKTEFNATYKNIHLIKV